MTFIFHYQFICRTKNGGVFSQRTKSEFIVIFNNITNQVENLYTIYQMINNVLIE